MTNPPSNTNNEVNRPEVGETNDEIQPFSGSNEVKTVEAVLLNVYQRGVMLGQGMTSESNPKRYTDADNMSIPDGLATIEKLLLEVIGDDGMIITTKTAEAARQINIENQLRDRQRTTLKAVLYGEKK